MTYFADNHEWNTVFLKHIESNMYRKIYSAYQIILHIEVLLSHDM